ncbi:MAG: polymerase, sigma-24 subunit, subfamily [Chlorobi bacterium]|nr:polymerase, sigma-24 subunit, subfamily [Chlorobiota bacterium]
MVDNVQEKLLEGRSGLLRYIRGKVGDSMPAEDILQDSLLKALRSAPDLRDDERIIPWFYRIINNVITDLYRHRDVETRYLARAVAEMHEEAVEQREVQAICACLAGIIPALKPEDALLIQELELRDADPQAMAERLGITRGNLKVRRHRARAMLRRQLEETCGACAEHGCLDCSCARKS